MKERDKTQNRWSPIELINWTAEYLGKKGFENCRLTAERLLAHVLKTDRVQLYLDFDKPLSADELSEFKILLKRRLSREPLQYILEQTEFFSLPMKISRGALIPRPETEILVEQVLKLVTDVWADKETVDILDVGTGSGVIAVSVALNLHVAHAVAVDISKEALDVARQNVLFHDVADRIELREQDALVSWPERFHSAFDVLIVNPPYISRREYDDLPSDIRDFEPAVALLAGDDGLSFYRDFARFVPILLKPGAYAFFEVGRDMAESVMQIHRGYPLSDFEIFPDLSGTERVLKMRRSDS